MSKNEYTRYLNVGNSTPSLPYDVDYDRKVNFAENLAANLTERTVKESAEDPDSFEKPYNPDDVYRSKGDYTVYESMMKDDQVDAAIQLKKDLVLGSGFEITGSEDVNPEIIEDVKQIGRAHV